MAFTIFGIKIGKARKRLTGAAATSAAGGGNAGGGRKKGIKNLKNFAVEEQRLNLQMKRLALDLKRAEIEDKRASLEAKRNRSGSPLGEMTRTLKEAKEIANFINGEKGESDDSFGGIARGVAENLGKGLGAAIGEMARQQMMLQAPPQPQVDVSTPPQLPAGSPAPQPVPEQEQLMMSVNRIMQTLTPLSAADAADWLARQHGYIEMQVKDALVNTPDQNIPSLIPQVRGFSPPMADWLAGRIPWLVEVAQHLRAMQQRPGSRPSGHQTAHSNVSPL